MIGRKCRPNPRYNVYLSVNFDEYTRGLYVSNEYGVTFVTIKERCRNKGSAPKPSI